jgi:hypothetical protein
MFILHFPVTATDMHVAKGKIPGIVCVLDWLNRATEIVGGVKSEITLDLRCEDYVQICNPS